MAIFPLHLLYSLQSCSAACFWWCTCMSSPWLLFIKYGPNIRKICHESLGDVTSYQMEQGLYYWKFINQFSFMALIYFLFLLIDKCNITIVNNDCLIFGNYAINRLLLHCPQHFVKNQHFEEVLYKIFAVVAISSSSVTILVSSTGWIITICRTPRHVSRLMDSLWLL